MSCVISRINVFLKITFFSLIFNQYITKTNNLAIEKLELDQHYFKQQVFWKDLLHYKTWETVKELLLPLPWLVLAIIASYQSLQSNQTIDNHTLQNPVIYWQFSYLTVITVVYPFLLLSVALMNAFSLLVAATVLFLVFLLFSSSAKNNKVINKWSSLSLISISAPLAVLAIGVSFTQPADWHAIPDTTYLDDKPLPAASLPEINPYSTALDKQGLSWQHMVLFKSAQITYDLIPNNTQWSQVVKGTLESEFVKTKVISTAFCTKVHLRAFMTAQPYLNGKKSINNL